MAEIMIDRSLDQVWSVFTDVSSWKTWWGGDLKSVTPGWQSGASVTWSTGGGTTVFDFVEKKRVGLKGGYGEKVVWVFSQAPGGRTSVAMGEDLSASGLVAASAAASQATHERKLLQLKNCIEGRYPTAAKTETPNVPVEDTGELTRAKHLLRTMGDDKATAAQKDAAKADLRKMSNLVPLLITKLQGTAWEDRDERIFAAYALGKIGDAKAVPALVAVLEVGDSNDQTWRVASIALGRIGDPLATDPLLAIFREGKFAQSQRGQVRADEKMHQRMIPAAYSLALLGVPEVEDAIKHMISHAGEPSSLPYVTTNEARMLQFASKQMRRKSLSPTAAADVERQELLEAIKSADVGRRKNACYDSATVGGIEIVQTLINALERDPGPQYNKSEDLFQSSRKGAAYALGKLGDPSSIPALVNALKNDSPWEVRDGRAVRRPDNPHRMELDMPVFGTSVREGLGEAETEFARSVLAQVPVQPASATAMGAARSIPAPAEMAARPSAKLTGEQSRAKKWWQLWR